MFTNLQFGFESLGELAELHGKAHVSTNLQLSLHESSLKRTVNFSTSWRKYNRKKKHTCPSSFPDIKSTKSFSLMVMVTSGFSAAPCLTPPFPFYQIVRSIMKIIMYFFTLRSTAHFCSPLLVEMLNWYTPLTCFTRLGFSVMLLARPANTFETASSYIYFNIYIQQIMCDNIRQQVQQQRQVWRQEQQQRQA